MIDDVQCSTSHMKFGMINNLLPTAHIPLHLPHSSFPSLQIASFIATSLAFHHTVRTLLPSNPHSPPLHALRTQGDFLSHRSWGRHTPSALSSKLFSLPPPLRGGSGGTSGQRISPSPPPFLSCTMSKGLHESSSGSSVLEGADAADEWLQLKGVEFELIEQTQATGKCRDSAAERGISLRQIVKSMVFLRADGGGHVQCCVPGHLQVDQGKLQAVVGAKCTLVEEEELFRVTGKMVGCVHPFVNGVVRRYIDKRVGKEGGLVSFNTGDMSRGLILSMEGLLTALGDQACIHDVACSEDGEEVDDLALEVPPLAPKLRSNFPSLC